MSKMLQPDELIKDIQETPSLMTGKAPAKGWMDTPAEFKPGNWAYSAKIKATDAIGAPTRVSGLRMMKTGNYRRTGKKLSATVSRNGWINLGPSRFLWISVSGAVPVQTSVIFFWEAATQKTCRFSGLNCSDPSTETILPLLGNC